MLNVKAEHVVSFLGRQITPLLAQEIGSQFATRIEGTCIKHRFGKCAIKLYDKHSIVLRIETTTTLQAPPQGGTPATAADARSRADEEDHLQPDRSA